MKAQLVAAGITPIVGASCRAPDQICDRTNHLTFRILRDNLTQAQGYNPINTIDHIRAVFGNV